MIRFLKACLKEWVSHWSRVDTRLENLETEMASVHDLIGQLVEKNRTLTTVVDGVETTLTTMSAALKEALNNVVSTGDTALLQDVISGLDSNIAELSASIATGTSASEEKAEALPTPVTTDTPLTADTPAAEPVPAVETPADTSAPVPAVETPAETPVAEPAPDATTTDEPNR